MASLIEEEYETYNQNRQWKIEYDVSTNQLGYVFSHAVIIDQFSYDSLDIYSTALYSVL